jgi:serine/threonine protein phosphatase PrpC/serine/threonine protein kinase
MNKFITILLLLLVFSIVNSSNDLIVINSNDDNDISDNYEVLKHGDSIDEFQIDEHLEYLGLPSLYWFDHDELIHLLEVSDEYRDESKTVVTTSSKMLIQYSTKPLLPEPSLLTTSSSSSASKGYIAILKQLRSNSTCIRNGTYCIEQLIFHGGHGDVYRANKIKDDIIEFNRSYILKRMYIRNRPAILKCAKREIFFGEFLRGQERIARYERYFQDNENYWLVFADEGVSLQSLLYVITVTNGLAVFEPSQFWVRLRTVPKAEGNNMMLPSIMKQIILGVAALHNLGVIHRDIKPSNILLNTENSKPKLIIADFSSALFVNDAKLNENLYGDSGPRVDEETLSYAPPEVLLSLSPGEEKPYDKNNPESYDTWSIGVVFLELLLGTGDVFSLDQRTSALINQRIRNNEKYKSDALLLAALADYCILPNDDENTNLYDLTLYDKDIDNNGDKKKRRKAKTYPLFKNADDLYLINDSPRCGLEELRSAILKRDPLAIGFNDIWGLDLIRRLLAFKPSDRISLSDALRHAYFLSPYKSADGREFATEEDLKDYESRAAQMINYNSTSMLQFSKDVITDITFLCSCGRKFTGDYNSCLKHSTSRGHGIRCEYNHNALPPCLSEHSFLPLDEQSGWCDLQGRRKYIEDKHEIVFENDHQFFVVLDGHFGVACSNYVGRNLYPILFEQLAYCEKLTDLTSSWNSSIAQMEANLDINNKEEWKHSIEITQNGNEIVFTKENKHISAAEIVCAIDNAFHQVNQNFILSKADESGTTVTVAMLFNNHLLVAHVGDSRLVLCCNNDGYPIQLTQDHNPYSSKEYDRVYANGGFVEENGGVLRVQGRLAITRSLGDRKMRNILSSSPDILMIGLEESKESKNKTINHSNNCMKYAELLGSAKKKNLMFFILGSDGLWESVSNFDATEIVCDYLMKELKNSQDFDKNRDTMHKVAKLLAHEAYLRGSMDNIGVCVTSLMIN